EPGRQLPQHRAELRRADERPDALVEERDARAEVVQPLDVRRVAAHLHREQEPWRALAFPVGDRALAWQAIEGRVDLDRVEVRREEGQPGRRRRAGGEEDAVSPVLVVPPGAADPDRLHQARCQWMTRGALPKWFPQWFSSPHRHSQTTA